MAVAVFLSNERGSTEVAIDAKATKEIVIIGRSFVGAVPVKIVSRTVPGVKLVRVVGMKEITNGEAL